MTLTSLDQGFVVKRDEFALDDKLGRCMES